MPAIKPFPVQGPIRPEGRQIGRAPAIDGLARQVIDLEQHTLLLADRRVGKTSMALAVLDRFRRADGWALEADLAGGPITSSGALAERLAEQARTAGVRALPHGHHAKKWMRKAIGLGEPALKLAASVLDVGELADAAELSAAVDEALAPVEEGGADLGVVLRAIRAAAIAADRPIVIFLDELQRLITHWDSPDDSLAAQQALAELMHTANGRVVLIVAGSVRTAVEQLLAPGQPMHYDGMTYTVPPIDRADWHHGLPERFREVGLTVEAAMLDQILEASGGHPQRTMRICAHVHQLADGVVFEVSDVLVGQAIAEARRHPSWRD